MTKAAPTPDLTVDPSASGVRDVSPKLAAHMSALEGEIARQRELLATVGAELEAERAARARAEKAVARDDVLMGMLGHDLRNPLNTVLMTAQLLEMRTDLPEGARPRIQRLILAGQRMQRMISQTLDTTRTRIDSSLPVTLEQVDVSALVSSSVDETRAAHPSRTLISDIEQGIHHRVDAGRIEQLLGNLLGNAMTHGDPGSPITLSLGTGADGVTLRVHNYGTPIAAEHIPTLFDPFTCGRRPRVQSAGLGLGLYVSERVVQAHGGTIRVSSTREDGTTFEVHLPRQ